LAIVNKRRTIAIEPKFILVAVVELGIAGNLLFERCASTKASIPLRRPKSLLALPAVTIQR
jgi:hypothetical protein